MCESIPDVLRELYDMFGIDPDKASACVSADRNDREKMREVYSEWIKKSRAAWGYNADGDYVDEQSAVEAPEPDVLRELYDMFGIDPDKASARVSADRNDREKMREVYSEWIKKSRAAWGYNADGDYVDEQPAVETPDKQRYRGKKSGWFSTIDTFFHKLTGKCSEKPDMEERSRNTPDYWPSPVDKRI